MSKVSIVFVKYRSDYSLGINFPAGIYMFKVNNRKTRQ